MTPVMTLINSDGITLTGGKFIGNNINQDYINKKELTNETMKYM
jgi:hypothetical protein